MRNDLYVALGKVVGSELWCVDFRHTLGKCRRRVAEDQSTGSCLAIVSKMDCGAESQEYPDQFGCQAYSTDPG